MNGSLLGETRRLFLFSLPATALGAAETLGSGLFFHHVSIPSGVDPSNRPSPAFLRADPWFPLSRPQKSRRIDPGANPRIRHDRDEDLMIEFHQKILISAC